MEWREWNYRMKKNCWKMALWLGEEHCWRGQWTRVWAHKTLNNFSKLNLMTHSSIPEALIWFYNFNILQFYPPKMRFHVSRRHRRFGRAKTGKLARLEFKTLFGRQEIFQVQLESNFLFHLRFHKTADGRSLVGVQFDAFSPFRARNLISSRSCIRRLSGITLLKLWRWWFLLAAAHIRKKCYFSAETSPSMDRRRQWQQQRKKRETLWEIWIFIVVRCFEFYFIYVKKESENWKLRLDGSKRA